MKLGRRPGFKRTSPMLRRLSPETIMISYQKWSWAEGPASKGQVQCFNTKSRNANDSWLKMKLGRRPSFKRTSPMLQNPSPATTLISYQKWSWAEASQGQVQCSNMHKSNAPTSKSRNNTDFLLKMKLGRRPSFKRTSPMLRHPSPETIMISY